MAMDQTPKEACFLWELRNREPHSGKKKGACKHKCPSKSCEGVEPTNFGNFRAGNYGQERMKGHANTSAPARVVKAQSQPTQTESRPTAQGV